MRKFSFVFSILFVVSIVQPVFSQSQFPGYFLIHFSDKNQTVYSTLLPNQYLSSRSIDRKNKFNINISSQDFPVNKWYVDSLRSVGIEVNQTSRWMNAALVEIDDSTKLSNALSFTFVTTSSYLGPIPSEKKKANRKDTGKENKIGADPENFGETYRQLDIIGATNMHSLGYRGNGIQIAVFDAGFQNADKIDAFDSLFSENRILGTIDFVKPGNNVFNENSHGTHCLSTIAGIIPGQYVGIAPEASFFLFRTENVSSEFPIEEVYWLIAAEVADSLGVDMITSSLGYSTFDNPLLNHYQSDLTGNTAIISKAAQWATEKGIMVVVSAGNEGNGNWRKIQFPADAKDVISVGAVDAKGDYANFSSQGFSADGRVKPDVVCIGKQTVLISPQNKIFKGNGTSFAAPTMAGAIALLMQANPEKSPSQIRDALKKSSSMYYHPDSLKGYGLPNIYMAHFLLNGTNFPNLETDETFQLIPNPCQSEFFVFFSSSDTQAITLEIIDITGNQVYKADGIHKNTGENFFRINHIERLNNGVYIVNIIDGNRRYSKRIVKTN